MEFARRTVGQLGVAAVVLAMFLTGCTSTPKDLTGQKLTPTSPDQVKLYAKKPSNYDIVGMVTVEITPDLTWDDRGNADKALNLMKAKAAAMGANGLLFEMNAGEADVTATAAVGGTYYPVPIRVQPRRTAIARAILVKS